MCFKRPKITQTLKTQTNPTPAPTAPLGPIPSLLITPHSVKGLGKPTTKKSESLSDDPGQGVGYTSKNLADLLRIRRRDLLSFRTDLGGSAAADQAKNQKAKGEGLNVLT